MLGYCTKKEHVRLFKKVFQKEIDKEVIRLTEVLEEKKEALRAKHADKLDLDMLITEQ